MSQSEIQIFAIFIGQCRYGEHGARQINALMFGKKSAVNDLASYVLALHRGDSQFDQSVGEQDSSSRLNIARQSLECCRDRRGCSLEVTGSDGDLRTSFQNNGNVIFEASRTNLR